MAFGGLNQRDATFTTLLAIPSMVDSRAEPVTATKVYDFSVFGGGNEKKRFWRNGNRQGASPAKSRA
jgi:hypothetical protein